MTPKEAIKNLKKLKSFHNGSYGTAIDHAIKALEQTELNPSYNSVKTELKPCEDCISREEAINVVHKYFVKYLKVNDDICLDGIRSLPSVTPQQPCEDCISRKEALRHRHIIYDDDGVGYSVVRVDEIEQLPSVTPKPCEEENPNCTECRYYDKEKHHCPRFCRVIENTMAEITSGQERPTAHFIRYINHNYSPFDNSPEYIMRCSNCGGALSEGAFYCPNCGAKMEEVDE